MAGQKRQLSAEPQDVLCGKKAKTSLEGRTLTNTHHHIAGCTTLKSNIEAKSVGNTPVTDLMSPFLSKVTPTVSESANSTIEASSPNSAHDSKLMTIPAEVKILLRNPTDTLETFLNNHRQQCQAANTLWRIMPQLAPLGTDQVTQFKNAVEDQVDLHLPDSDAEPDTEDEKEGRYNHDLASLPKSRRVSLLRDRILDLAQEHGIKRGKWMIFYEHRNDLFAAYERLALETDQGRLGHAIEAVYDQPGPRGALYVWTKDKDDREDVRHVLQSILQRLSISSQIRYKPEAFSLLGLRKYNSWGIKMSQYNSRDLMRVRTGELHN